MRKMRILACAVGALGLAAQASASSVPLGGNLWDQISSSPADRGVGITLGFVAITSNGIGSPEIAEAQLSVNIMNNGGLKFTFINSGPFDSVITEIYFDETTTFLGAVIDGPTGAGTSFTPDAGSPPDLPSGNNLSPNFDATRRVTADNPSPDNGVGPGEMVMFTYALIGNFNDFVDELMSGEFRIGIHVQAFENGESESLVNCINGDCDTPLIPLPNAAGLGALGMGVMLCVRRRRG